MKARELGDEILGYQIMEDLKAFAKTGFYSEMRNYWF